jgi:hypothetical protein
MRPPLQLALFPKHQTVLSGGKNYQMAWTLIYNTDFLDARLNGWRCPWTLQEPNNKKASLLTTGSCPDSLVQPLSWNRNCAYGGFC